MPKRTNITKNQAVQAIVDSTNGKPIRQVAKDNAISNRAARKIADAAGVHIEELRAEVRLNLQETQLKLAKKVNAECESLSISQAFVPLGIVSEKLNLVESTQTQQPTTQINVLINGESKTKQQVIEGLFGNAKAPGPPMTGEELTE